MGSLLGSDGSLLGSLGSLLGLLDLSFFFLLGGSSVGVTSGVLLSLHLLPLALECQPPGHLLIEVVGDGGDLSLDILHF